MNAYLPLAILFVVALVISAAILLATTLLGPRVSPSPHKLLPYECGVAPEGDTHRPFQFRFYVIAVLFLLFDVEAAFFFPLALVYRESLTLGSAIPIAFCVYSGLVILGLCYILKKNALELD